MPPGPRGAQPAWIRYFADLASRLAGDPAARGSRTVLALPTAQLSAAALAVGAVAHLAEQRIVQPLARGVGPDDVGRCVSVFFSGGYHDVPLRHVEDGALTVANTTLTKYTDVVRLLPESFEPRRGPRQLPRDVVHAWARVVPDGVDAARVHARVSAQPVVVIGDHGPLGRDLAALTQGAWPGCVNFVDAHHEAERWFRHPLFICSSTTAPEPWMRDVEVACVIVSGAAAWRSAFRQVFADAPHVLVLDRRSETAVELVGEIVSSKPTAIAGSAEPPPGIEAWVFEEQPLATSIDIDEGDLF